MHYWIQLNLWKLMLLKIFGEWGTKIISKKNLLEAPSEKLKRKIINQVQKLTKSGRTEPVHKIEDTSLKRCFGGHFVDY